MKIAVTAENEAGLEAPVCEHFGHAPYFVFVEAEGENIVSATTVANPFAEGHAPGQIPGFIHEQGAGVIISGGMGGRAVGFFTELGIAAATGASGTVSGAVQAYLRGDMGGAAPCAESVAHGHG